MAENVPPNDPARWWDEPEDYYNDDEKDLAKLEPAWAKAALQLRDEFRFGHLEGQELGRSLEQVHEELETRRKRVEAGDRMELLYALLLCLRENLPATTWLALDLIDALEGFFSPGGPSSLDQVFRSDSLPTNTPQKTETARRDREQAGKLWAAVKRVARSHTALDPALEQVLRSGKFAVGKTKARALVTRFDKQQAELTGNETLSQFWAKRRKE